MPVLLELLSDMEVVGYWAVIVRDVLILSIGHDGVDIPDVAWKELFVGSILAFGLGFDNAGDVDDRVLSCLDGSGLLGS